MWEWNDSDSRNYSKESGSWIKQWLFTASHWLFFSLCGAAKPGMPQEQDERDSRKIQWEKAEHRFKRQELALLLHVHITTVCA